MRGTFVALAIALGLFLLRSPEHSPGPVDRIAALFNRIDPHIMRDVNQGKFDLRIRMQPSDIAELRTIIAADSESPPLAVIEETGEAMANSTFNDGTLGPTGPVPIQQWVAIHVDSRVAQ